jgi:hypothetical protein
MQDKTKKAVNSDFSKRVGCGDVDDQNVVLFLAGGTRKIFTEW